MRPFSKLMMVIAAATLLASCGKGGGVKGSADAIGMGKADAPVKMVEYGSSSCPHCAAFNNDVLPALKEKYIDTGVVHYELREVTTPPHNFAAAAFLTARCAGDDKYYAVIDAVYRKQSEIVNSRQTGNFAADHLENFRGCQSGNEQTKNAAWIVLRNGRADKGAGAGAAFNESFRLQVTQSTANRRAGNLKLFDQLRLAGQARSAAIFSRRDGTGQMPADFPMLGSVIHGALPDTIRLPVCHISYLTTCLVQVCFVWCPSIVYSL